MTDPVIVFWTAAAAVATALSALFAAYSAWLVRSTASIMKTQTNEMKRATYAGAFKDVFDILQEESVREARRSAILEMPTHHPSIWPEHKRQSAEKVMYTYDAVGVMIRNELIPVDVVTNHWGNSIKKCWSTLEPYVKYQREERKAPELYDDFEWLAQQAMKK